MLAILLLQARSAAEDAAVEAGVLAE